MPAAHDIYNEELRCLRRGDALYHPEPAVGETPIEIGDVGYTKQGAFSRLFNVCRPADDPVNDQWGVPEGFQPLDMGRVQTYNEELGPGPLHSETISHAAFDIGASGGVVLPADVSFRFSCTASRGAILMLETHMSRTTAQQDGHFKSYMEQHCVAWYGFASANGIRLDLGDIILVTECSKTAAWASAVYSQSSRDFGLQFSVGGAFLPISNGIGVSTGHTRLGSVQRRRSQRRAIASADVEGVVYDQTVFIKGFRPGPRHLYPRSFACKIRKLINKDAGGHKRVDLHGSPLGPGSLSPGGLSLVSHSDNNLGPGDLVDVSSLSLELPDFHPAVALLAHAMETTHAQVVIVHDDEWCSVDNKDTAEIIDSYARAFFGEEFLERMPAADRFNEDLIRWELTDYHKQSTKRTAIFIVLLFTAVITFRAWLAEIRNGIWGSVSGADNHGHGHPVSAVVAFINHLCLHARRAHPEPFVWSVFSQQFSTWLLPWLALLSQLPFGTHNNFDNLVSVLLTVGSPTLAAYSLALTVLNGQWIVRRFAGYSYPNVGCAVRILKSLQQVPLTVTTRDALLASLVILPENDEWWRELVNSLSYTHTWSVAAVASIIWVVIAYVLTMIESSIVDPPSIQSSGQGVGYLWLWLLPIVIGWLQLSPKCDSKQLHQAVERTNKLAYVATQSGMPVLASSLFMQRAISLSLRHEDPMRCDEQCSAPIYNYSRFLPWTQAVEDVAKVFHAASDRALMHMPVDPQVDWVTVRTSLGLNPRNRRGTLDQVGVYAIPIGDWKLATAGRKPWPHGIWSRFLVASVLALSLQWGTTGAAIVVVGITPAPGPGFRLSAYLLYGVLSTISWMIFVLSSFLSHYSRIALPKSALAWIARELSILLRQLGKVIASINAIWIIMHSSMVSKGILPGHYNESRRNLKRKGCLH